MTNMAIMVDKERKLVIKIKYHFLNRPKLFPESIRVCLTLGNFASKNKNK